MSIDGCGSVDISTAGCNDRSAAASAQATAAAAAAAEAACRVVHTVGSAHALADALLML